jgi:hypothetical protein
MSGAAGYDVVVDVDEEVELQSNRALPYARLLELS